MRLEKDLFVLALPAAMARSVSISVDAGKLLGNLTPTARFFGADEPNYAYYPDGRALLSELGSLGPAQTYFRTHNLLTTGDGVPALKWGSTNAYTLNENGQPIYNWTIVDEIFEAYLTRNVKPYVQIGFMPKALSSHPNPYTFNFTPSSPYYVIYTGWSYPPTSYQEWGELVYQWAKHCVEKYGAKEVESWYWEVWNEPNIQYWNGTEQEYYELYDYAVAAVRKALPTARVGGPEVAGGGTGSSGTWLSNFFEHTLRGKNNATGETGSPIDFLSFHAKGAPTYVNTSADSGYVQMNVSAQLQNVQDGFKVIDSFPELKDKPIVIGEDDPDGCAACITPQYGYRNGLIYPSYTAASFVRDLDLAAKWGVNLQGTLTWAFEYDDHPYFDGFRVLATNQIDKPILNVFRMLGKMTGQRVQAQSSGQVPLETVVQESVRNATDVGVLASLDQESSRLYIFVWHYHDDDLPKPDAEISLDVEGLTGWHGGLAGATLTHYRIDESHSNSYQKWLDMGSPQEPTSEQYVELKAAGMLQTLGQSDAVQVAAGKMSLDFTLPIHSLSLLVLDRF